MMPLKKIISLFLCPALVITLFAGCKTAHTATGSMQQIPFLKQGHRGTRGLMPENTIPAMKKGILAGANTVELDVHISKDNQVLVYHDASVNPDYTSFADGSDIARADRKKYTFYQITYDEARQFIVGRKPYAPYPQQERLDSYIPLLGELIDSVEQFTQSHGLPAVYYNVEIKSNAKTDGVDQPTPEVMVKLVMDVLQSRKLGSRLFIQSFDERPLQVLHRQYPHIILGYLTDNKTASFDENIAKLGFIPDFYNPQYKLVTKELLDKCHEKKSKVCPWTVETKEEMIMLKAMGVDGIITDYPNLFEGL